MRNRPNAENEYAQTARLCPTCNGSGVNPVLLTKVCPKCNGEKVIPRG